MSGYKPCDPQVIRERVAHMEFCYQELSQLAAERRARLEESRRLWKFFWEMAEEVCVVLSEPPTAILRAACGLWTLVVMTRCNQFLLLFMSFSGVTTR